MPELPEVESVRRGLVHARLREPVVEVWRSEKPLRIGRAWRRENLNLLIRCRPGRLSRRGKHLLWEFRDEQDLRYGLVIHLGMSGRFGLAHRTGPLVPHTHFILTFADGRQVRLVDPRRFGGLRAGPLQWLEAQPPLAELGPEPLGRGFCGAELRASGGKSRRVIRDVLLDQRTVAGIGNIYAVEALFEAGIHPLVRAHRLTESAWDVLAEALRSVLSRAIENGGTTLKDFRDVTGKVGRNQDDLRVYGRAGGPCPSCGRLLREFAHGGRGGVYCPVDQPRRRRTGRR